MTHRVHTILSILADDHAPAALRPSILLAIDWPTVAEEAPATGDDATAATLAALRIRGAITSDHQALATCAARIATVAASLTTTGDKAHALHAIALWSAAAALVGLGAPVHVLAEVPLAAPLHDILGLKPLIDGGADIKDTVRDLKAAHDKALADIHALRDILKVPAGGNIVDHADAAMKGAAAVREDNARLRAQVDRMIAAMRDDAPTPTPTKPRPQPGDVVPWIETEDGCLYADDDGSMLAQWRGRCLWVWEPSENLYGLLTQDDGWLASERKDESGPKATIVARDLGTDPEAWRAAMREWMANHATKSHAPDRISCPHRQDGDASACDHCCMFG